MKISKEAQIAIVKLHIKYNSLAKQEITKEGRQKIKLEHTLLAKDLITKEGRQKIKFKVGDIVETSIGGYRIDPFKIGKVKKVEVEVDIYHNSYYIIYTCERLTKELNPYKSGQEFCIRQRALSLY